MMTEQKMYEVRFIDPADLFGGTMRVMASSDASARKLAREKYYNDGVEKYGLEGLREFFHDYRGRFLSALEWNISFIAMAPGEWSKWNRGFWER